MRALRPLLLASSAALLASCTTYRDYKAVHLSSTPPGASVLVDGVPSGFATPCMLALEKKTQVVSLDKSGYLIAERQLVPDPYNDTWYWREASVGPHTFKFGLWINLDDFITPIKRMNELEASRIHVHLKRLADL
jgi:hypothetical protein